MEFKAGKYYVGDLCYVISDDNWDKLLDETNYLEDENISYKGFPIWCNNTAYGDGSFKDNKGRNYSVDAGIIGVMPVEAMDETSSGGNIIEFETDFEADYCDGTFYIGDIIIQTGYDEEEDICECCGEQQEYCECELFDNEEEEDNEED